MLFISQEAFQGRLRLFRAAFGLFLKLVHHAAGRLAADVLVVDLRNTDHTDHTRADPHTRVGPSRGASSGLRIGMPRGERF